MKGFQPEGNYFNKYENNGIIINLIMNGFFKHFDCLIESIAYSTVYEAGCGEGYISQHVHNFNTETQKTVRVLASDMSDNVIDKAKMDFPYIHFKVNSIYSLEEANDSIDFVIASEVLEHLEKPEKALAEIFRISRKYVLISVPSEPIWRISNFVRGKYVRFMGNTPGHINHWTRKQIVKLVTRYGKILEVRSPFPWTMILCEKKR